MEIQIENLRAQMRGVQLNDYQKALALYEYYKLLDYVEKLEKLTGPDVVESFEGCSICGDDKPPKNGCSICKQETA